MEDEWTALEYWVFFSKNKIKLFIFLNMVVFPELALVHKGAQAGVMERCEFLWGRNRGGALLQSQSVGNRGDLQKEQQWCPWALMI